MNSLAQQNDAQHERTATVLFGLNHWNEVCERIGQIARKRGYEPTVFELGAGIDAGPNGRERWLEASRQLREERGDE